MHHVDIPPGELNEFDLPPICIVTGERQGVVFKPVNFTWYPRWIGFLALLNLLIAIIVASAMTKRVTGTLPFTEEAWSRWKRGQVIMVVSVVVAIALLILAFSLLASDAPEWLGVVALASSVAVPVLAWVYFLRGRGPQVRRIDKDNLSLAIPNGPAAYAIAGHFLAGLKSPALDDGESLDANGAPARALCARHDDIVATQVCTRCGAFMCPRCENRIRREALPLCPGCWELRGRTIAVQAKDPGITLVNSGLFVGVISVIPMCYAAHAVSLVLNTVSLVRNRHPDSPRIDRKKAIAGLALTGIGLLLTLGMRLYSGGW
ncbi:hypothetical protein COCOR_00750 [Corallococcus coralloides DSM 2259]|uniref:Uncharacterized protein n=1 Tax=Corallococcus coralloides (strain ATCC 25202 / DSM 2259 / NBRC 100086 / M2) TaxID=1144275 RepID=H8MHH1_CORCM|nr:hypothetical protein [Corallococcus coralloides]AFE03688.1 hypothetical protein COCOR_00750 [Corallococcus coralloides DSM 2259]